MITVMQKKKKVQISVLNSNLGVLVLTGNFKYCMKDDYTGHDFGQEETRFAYLSMYQSIY